MKRKLDILLVDDDRNFVEDFVTLSGEVFAITATHSGEEALKILENYEPDAIILDLRLGTGIDGIETLQLVRRKFEEMPVIIVTDHADVDTAVRAIKLGAVHYTSKHPNMLELQAMIQKELSNLKWKWLYQSGADLRYGGLLGQSFKMKQIFRMVDKVAKTEGGVLIEGESGTGKELIARELHLRSHRAQNPFVVVDCGAIPGPLFESELFGHERGAFTGATTKKKGKFELADGGTVFLDELGNLGPLEQAKLLRVLESGAISRLGSEKEIEVDVRIIGASNCDLKEMVGKGTFREDLYYRLATVPIHLPPLRERKEDIPMLAEHFNRIVADRYSLKPVRFTVDAMKRLKSSPWPGNVRELQHFIEKLVILNPGRLFDAGELPLDSATQSESKFGDFFDMPYSEARDRALGEFKKAYILNLLNQNNNNYTLAAKQAGLPRPSLHRMVKEIEKM